jgi:hypothetical protein
VAVVKTGPGVARPIATASIRSRNSPWCEARALADDLPLHQREVGGRPAESETAQFEEEERERPEIGPSDKLAHRSRLRHARKSQGV